MEAIKQKVRIPEDHEIKIKIPYYIPENEVVEVFLIVKKKPAAFKQKVEELKEAVRDKVFLDDLRRIHSLSSASSHPPIPYLLSSVRV